MDRGIRDDKSHGQLDDGHFQVVEQGVKGLVLRSARRTEPGRAMADFIVSAQCNRVAVRDGHLIAVSAKLRSPQRGRRPAGLAEVAAAFTNYRGEPQRLGLPTAPDPAIILHTAEDRPQPQLDRMAGAGMATSIGRLRPDPIFDYKFVVLGHNTIRGAAGGAILNAELLRVQGHLDLS